MLAIGFVYSLLSNVRDELPSDIQERFHVTRWLPDLPLSIWAVALLGLTVCVLLEAGYRANKKTLNERDGLSSDLNNLRTPKLEILFDPDDKNHFLPPEKMSHHIYSVEYERQINVTVRNVSIDCPIRKMELYCETVEVVKEGKEVFCGLSAAGASYYPRDLTSLEPHLCGVLREYWKEHESTKEIIVRSFDVICPLKCSPFGSQGLEFLMKLIAYGEGTCPVEAWFRFGERDSVFFFEQEPKDVS